MANKSELGNSNPEGIQLLLTPELFMQQKFSDPRPHFAGRLEDILYDYGQKNEIPRNLTFGVHKFVRSWNVQEKNRLKHVLGFADGLFDSTGRTDFFKSNSFNYISEGETLPEVLDQALKNALFLTKLVGPEFFAREGKKRASLFRAPIADTDFVLTCKGGSGAGTFSLDFAIGIDRERNPLDTSVDTSGELWRTGIDTEYTESKRSIRIIRTGSAVKHDPEKMAKFKEFRKKFNISPQRALTFLSLYVAYIMGADKVKALTTTGAMNLSSLSRSKDPYEYSKLFREAGFEEKLNQNWFVIPRYTENFYPTLRTASITDHGLHRQETDGLDNILKAFQNLRKQDGKEFPIPLIFSESRSETEKIFDAFGTIYGRPKGY